MDLVFGHWSFGPVIAVLAVAVAVHQVGYHRRQQVVIDRDKPSYRLRRYQMWTFVSAMGVLAVAFESPIDYYSETLFWVHMIQHLLLTVVAAPLIVVSAPWLVLLRGLPPVSRRRVSRVALGARWLGPIRSLGAAVNRPVVAWLVFTTNFWAWHMPVLYDLTLTNQTVHYLEHALFLGVGVLFWMQVIDSYPLRSRLTWMARIAFLVADAVQNWILAMALVFASGPWYSGYAHLASRPGGITAFEDQQLGGGIMWIPGMIPVAVAVALLANRFVSSRGAGDMDRELSRVIDAETRAGKLPAPGRWRVTLAPRHHLD